VHFSLTSSRVLNGDAGGGWFVNLSLRYLRAFQAPIEYVLVAVVEINGEINGVRLD